MTRLPPAPDEVSAATAFGFTPDGRELFAGHQLPGFASGHRDAAGTWWEVAAGRVAHRRVGPDLTVGGDGRFVSTYHPGQPPVVRAFALDAAGPRAEVAVDPPDFAVRHRVLPGDAGLAVTHRNRLVVHRLPAGTEAEAAKAAGFSDEPGLSPGGRWLFARTDRGVRLWDRTQKLKLTRLPAGSGFAAAAVSADDRWAAADGPTGGGGTVWDVATKAAVLRIDLAGAQPQGLAWTPDGRLLVAAGQVVRTWDVAAGREAEPFVLPAGSACGLAVAPDGLTAAALLWADGRVAPVVWDL